MYRTVAADRAGFNGMSRQDASCHCGLPDVHPVVDLDIVD